MSFQKLVQSITGSFRKKPEITIKSKRTFDDLDSPHYTNRPLKQTLFASNHVMVNRSRIRDGKKPLTRSIELDDLAHEHAMIMASKGSVFHSAESFTELQNRLGTQSDVGENVHRGDSIKHIHDLIEWNPTCRMSKKNMLSSAFTEFGMGTALGDDGQLYLCQLYRAGNEKN